MSTLQAQVALAQRVLALAESETLAMTKKARELKAQGVQVINLSIGEPDFKTPDHICEAAKKAIDDGFTFYPPVAGFPELRQGIAQKLKRDNGLPWEAENVVVSTGAKQSLANVLLSLINPGDEVLILAPYWVSYRELVKLAEGTPVVLTASLEQGFKVSPEQLEKAITPRTKAIMYSSPSNPTGAVYTEAELRALATVIEKHEQIYVIADEIYEYITYRPEGYFSMGAIPAVADRVITVNGFSKGYAMTGWRLGYIGAAKWIAAACEKIQGQVTSGTCSIAQRAAIAAINGDLAPSHQMTKAYHQRRDLIVSLANQIPGMKTYVPEGAFYLFPDISAFFGKSNGQYHIANANDLCNYLIDQAHVALVPGDAFGAPNHLRISYAASEEQIREAMQRLQQYLALLQ